MTVEGMLDYASTRVQAQHGGLPGNADWRALEATRDLGQYLDAARHSALARWVSSFDPGQDLHTIERSLRSEWTSHVELVASWHPRAAQPWLAWLAWLPTLSLLARLARDVPAPPWLLADPVCGPVAVGSPAQRAEALGKTSLAPLAPGVAGDASIAALWRARWNELTPAMGPRTRDHHAQLQRALDRHGQSLKSASSALTLRASLAEHLEVLFRRAHGTVVATACHLGRLALELERLRGGLAIRYAQVSPAQAAAGKAA